MLEQFGHQPEVGGIVVDDQNAYRVRVFELVVRQVAGYCFFVGRFKADGEPECRAFAFLAFQADLAAHEGDQLFADR